MVYIPILAGLALATGTIIEKLVLMKRKISAEFYETIGFFALILVMTPFIFFFWKMDSQALAFHNIIIFSIIVILAVLANYFTFKAMKKGKLSKIEPVKVTEPLFTIILAVIFGLFFTKGIFSSNPRIIIPAIIGGIALIFPHIKKHHLEFNRNFRLVLLGSFLFALELVVSRLILDYYNGLTFYFLRCSFVFIISLIVFRPKIRGKLNKKISFHILIASIIWIGYRLLLYYGYERLGVIETSLMVMLGPVFIYIFAWKFLHDKPTWKNLLASVVILLCIVFTTLF
ncbi:MAG: DMT family transporter [Nanoarchaeota archaeon]|nr:DMT family transporter [Nanoarchaeota archaeon]